MDVSIVTLYTSVTRHCFWNRTFYWSIILLTFAFSENKKCFLGTFTMFQRKISFFLAFGVVFLISVSYEPKMFFALFSWTLRTFWNTMLRGMNPQEIFSGLLKKMFGTFSFGISKESKCWSLKISNERVKKKRKLFNRPAEGNFSEAPNVITDQK